MFNWATIVRFRKVNTSSFNGNFVVIGAILDGFGLYDKLIKFAGAGATVPITSFGHSLLHGAMHATEKHGYLGIGIGMFSLTSAGISARDIVFIFIALICKPKG